jgi:hypothetical protein
MTLTLNARPHINGNSEADFFAAAIAFDKVFSTLEEALSKVRANVTHGRNYQHLDRDTAMFRRNDDVNAIKAKADTAREALAAIMDALIDLEAVNAA